MAQLARTCFALLLLSMVAPAALTAEAQPAAVSAAVKAPPTTATGPSPQAVVERLHEAIIESMMNADELGFEGRYALLAPVVNESFDLGFMGSKCVGRHWKKLSDEEQKTWLEKFARLTTSNYAGRFDEYDGERFETLGQEPGTRETQMVLTKLYVPSDKDVLLNYRLIEKAGHWRIIDVYLNGTVSELAMRRSEYASTLKRGGYDKLASAIDRKIEDLREDGGG